MGQAEPDAIVVGGQLVGAGEVAAGGLDGVGIDVDLVEDLQGLDGLGVLGQAVAEEAAGLGEAALLAEQQDERPAGHRPVRPGDLQGGAQPGLGVGEPATGLLDVGPVQQGQAEVGRAVGDASPGVLGAVGVAEHLLGQAEHIEGLAVARPPIGQVDEQAAGGGVSAVEHRGAGLGQGAAEPPIGLAPGQQPEPEGHGQHGGDGERDRAG